MFSKCADCTAFRKRQRSSALFRRSIAPCIADRIVLHADAGGAPFRQAQGRLFSEVRAGPRHHSFSVAYAGEEVLWQLLN